MSTPLVSVFIPVYNSENYIQESIDSIINQTYQNLEILIVDDGSTDNSINIVKSYSDNRIRLIRNEQNKGIPYSRNLALKEAKGKYLANMDSDDVSNLNRIETQVQFMEKNLDVVVVSSNYKTFGQGKEKMIKSKVFLSDDIKISLLFSNPIANPTSFIRLQKLKDFNIEYNNDFFVAQDYDMWVQISKKGKIVILPETLLSYRKGHANITSKSKTKKEEQRKKIIDSIHIDLIDYYNFDLSETEIITYNNFFSENPGKYMSDTILFEIGEVLKKIINQNLINNNFDNSKFLSVMNMAIVNKLSNSKVNLSGKIITYLKINKCRGKLGLFKNLVYILLKHIQLYLRS